MVRTKFEPNLTVQFRFKKRQQHTRAPRVPFVSLILRRDGDCKRAALAKRVNPSSPSIHIQILQTDLVHFLKELVERI